MSFWRWPSATSISTPKERMLWLVLSFAFVCSVIIGALNAMYTDEVGYHILKTRFIVDRFTLISFFPQCEESFATTPPILWWPIILLRSLLHELVTGPYTLRALGVVRFLLLMLLFERIAHTVRKWDVAPGILILAVASVGQLPYLLTLNRPETSLVLFVGLLVLIALRPSERASVRLFQFALSFTIIQIMLSLHPISTMFAPLFIFLPVFQFKGTWSRICGVCLISGSLLSAWMYFSEILNCKNAPMLSAKFSTVTLNTTLLFDDPITAMSILLQNSVKSFEYLLPLAFQTRNEFRWMEIIALPSSVERFTGVLILVLWGYISLLAIFVSLHRGWRDRLRFRNSASALGFLLICCLAIVAGARGLKHFYSATLIFPLLGLVWLLVIERNHTNHFQHMKVLMGWTLSVSVVVSVAINLLSLRQSVQRVYALPDIDALSLSFPLNMVEDVATQISKASDLCGITSPSLQHVVIDDVTYWHFRKSFLPFHITYVTKQWGKDITNLGQFLTQKKSSGLIVQCSQLPDMLKSVNTKVGDICCMSADDLRRQD